MTELLLLLAFLRQWSNVSKTSCYVGLIHDIRLLERITNFVDSAKALDYFAQVITDLCRLDDAIVMALSSKQPFSYESTVFSRKRKSVLPKFYYGPLSSVFDDDGNLRKRFNTVSVQFCLESLRLVRRAKSKAFTKKAADAAADKFINYQNTHRPGNDVILDEMTQMWYLFENQSDFYDSLKYGRPGSGVTQDMRFPYVPDLCFLSDHDSKYPTVTGALNKAFEDLDPFARHTNRYFNHCLSECQFVGFYSAPVEGIASLSIVDKKFDEGRAITVTDTARTIKGAITRNSIFEHHRRNGSISMVDVFDQTSSHRVLEEHFSSVACLDLAGGSSCLTIENLDRMLSKTTFVGSLWKDSRPNAFKWKNQVFELSTLTMGDASSVGLLTTTLWLCLVLGYMKYHGIPLHSWGFRVAVTEMRRLGMFRTVGDDLIFPDYLYETILCVLLGIGVTINERKSSRANSHHKESCGAWFISNGLKVTRRIYPFRAAVSKTRDLASVTQVIEQYVEKNENSPFAYALFLAHTQVLLPLDYRITYERLRSFHPSIVGTRFGQEWSHVYRTVRGSKQYAVPDWLAYVCGLKDSLCTPRWNRRPDVARFRVRKKPMALGDKRSKNEHLAIAIAMRMLASWAPGLLRGRPRPGSTLIRDHFDYRRMNGYYKNPHYQQHANDDGSV